MNPYICAIDSSVFINLVEIQDCKSIDEVKQRLLNRKNGKTTFITNENARGLLEFKNKVLSGEIVPYLTSKVYDEVVNSRYRNSEEDTFRHKYCKNLDFNNITDPTKKAYYQRVMAKIQTTLVRNYISNGIFPDARDMNDAIIMAQACSFGLSLVTMNIKHSIDTNCNEQVGNVKRIVKSVNRALVESEMGKRAIDEQIVSPFIKYVEPASCATAVFEMQAYVQEHSSPYIENANYLNSVVGADIIGLTSIPPSPTEEDAPY